MTGIGAGIYDTYSFEELPDINDAELYDGLWNVLSTYFKKSKSQERALDGVERVIDLYAKPIEDELWREIPRRPADHYRTREELVAVSRNPRVVEALIEEQLLRLHPKWPLGLRDHRQAPYRPDISELAQIRDGVLSEKMEWGEQGL